MKLFYFPTAVAVGLFVSYLMIMRCHRKIHLYEKRLTPEERSHYIKIRNYRISCYIFGLLLSLLMASFYLWKQGINYRSVAISLVIVLFLPMIVYMIIPKRHYMLLYSENDAKEWFEIYLCMKNSMIYGFLLGFFVSLGCLYVHDQIR